jgi:hypothetical protein
MKKGITGRNHLKPWFPATWLCCGVSAKAWGIQDKGLFVSHGKMRQSAHMKSFSWIDPHLQTVAGSREHRRCSRIANTC